MKKRNLYYYGGYVYTWLTVLCFGVFTTLKLTGVISWSWWWVTFPIWGSFAFFTALLLVLYLIFKKHYEKTSKSI